MKLCFFVLNTGCSHPGKTGLGCVQPVPQVDGVKKIEFFGYYAQASRTVKLQIILVELKTQDSFKRRVILLHALICVRPFTLDTHHWYVSPPRASPFVYHRLSSPVSCVPGWLPWPPLPRRAEATEERKPETTDLDATIFNSSAQRRTKVARLGGSGSGSGVSSGTRENMFMWRQRAAVRSSCHTLGPVYPPLD